MAIAVLGTGPVGQTVAAKLAELGHEVTVGTRDVEATMAATEPDTFGRPPFSEWSKQHPSVAVGQLAESLGWSDIVDLGDITTARGTEMYLPLWARIWGATQNPMFNIKVVR